MNNAQKKSTLKVSTDATTKAAFSAKARELDMKEAGLLRLVIEAFLKTNPADETVSNSTTEKNDGTLRFRISQQLKDELKIRAGERGLKPSRYVVLLLKAQFAQREALTDEEVNVLRESNFELSAVGRSLNQLFKTIHARSGDTKNTVGLTEVAALVKKVRDDVRVLIRSNMKSWGVSDGQKYGQ